MLLAIAGVVVAAVVVAAVVAAAAAATKDDSKGNKQVRHVLSVVCEEQSYVLPWLASQGGEQCVCRLTEQEAILQVWQKARRGK